MDGAAPAALGATAPPLIIDNAPASPEYGQVLRHVGQTLSVTLVEQGENGARLELPSGQIISASGNLPFPEQTKLQVRASVQDGVIVLRVLEALPPAPPALLAPLINGEAAGLLQRLQAKELPEALVPLANLFTSLFVSNDAKLQKSVESLPPLVQRLVSEMLGLKDGSAAQISHSLAEDLEPIESLLDAQMTTENKQNVGSQSKIMNEQNLNPSINVLINQLREVFARYFEQNNKEDKIANMKTIESLIESIKNVFSSKSTDTPNALNISSIALQKSPNGENTIGNFEKLLYAIKIMPNDARRFLSEILSGNMDSEPETIAKNIMSKIEGAAKAPERATEEENHIRADQAFTKSPLTVTHRPAPPDMLLRTVSQKILQTLIALPAQTRRELSSALLGFAEAEPKAIAEHLAQKALAANQDKTVIAAMEKAPADILRTIERALAEVGQRPSSHPSGQLLDKGLRPGVPNGSAAGSNEQAQTLRIGADKIAPVPESVPGSSGDGPHAEVNKLARASDGVRTFANEGQRLDAKKGSLASNAYPGMRVSNRSVSVKVPSVPTSPNVRVSNDEAAPPDANKLAQALGNLPIAVRRALASATVGHADAEPITIADFLVRRGTASEAKQNFVSVVESAPPLARQILALLASLPINASTRHIVEALGSSGGEEILLAAKALAAGAEPALLKPYIGQDRESAAAKKDGKAVNIFVNRLKYLLRFEGLVEGLNLSRQFPLEDRNAVSNWFRSIVDLLIMIKSEKNELGLDKQSQVFQSTDAQKPAAPERSIELPAAHGAADPEKSPTWQSWLKGAIKALVDPHVSPEEAFFHALAAKENVNYFELPLPWAQGRNLEIWVEDGNEESSAHDKKNKKKYRVLLALNFSAIGETRVGLESSSKLLSINVWAEKPQSIENELPQMRNELSALGFDANISINSLVSGPDGIVPTIKSQIVGSSLHVLG